MADATEREREARAVFRWVMAVMADAQRTAFEADLNAYGAAVEARVLADVIAMVGEWFSESRSYIVTSEELAMLNSCESNLLTRLRAMEGHTDG